MAVLLPEMGLNCMIPLLGSHLYIVHCRDYHGNWQGQPWYNGLRRSPAEGYVFLTTRSATRNARILSLTCGRMEA